VSVPESLLRELVAGVVQNAIEASPPNGRIHVTARVATNGVEVSVTDEGEGIPEALRERVFEPFFTTKEAGVVVRGFGLTMVKSIVDALGGRVTVGDAPAGGACVRVLLPAAERGD
jgi:signal transduction histidine kinase